MTFIQLPVGWTMDQLQALNNLVELNNAYQIAKTVKTLLNDTSPAAQQVLTDLANLARNDWAIVTTYSA